MSENFARINSRAAGIDLGSEMLYVSSGEDQPVCSFASTTPELERLIAYLQQQGVASVAMESTGVLWLPLYEMLEEAGISICLVNGAHARNVPGRKSDVADCQWLRQLHEYGLLRRSFIPPETIRVLRTYLRLRIEHITMASQHVQHMQRALELMNLKLHLVIEQLQGASGLRVLKAIIDGERDAEKLLALCDVRIRSNKAAEFRAALSGHYRAEHVFALKQAIDCWEYYHQKISECDQEIDSLLERITCALPQPPEDAIGPTKPGRHHRFGGDASSLHRMMVTLSGGVNLASLPGFSDLRALEALSEVGTDMTAWPSEKHFSGWLNLAPSMHRSGKSKRRRRRHGSPRAAQIFRLAAQSVAKSSSALGAFYRRIRARSGPAIAVKATAHKIAVIFYRMMRYGQAYVERGVEEYERNVKEHQLKNLQRRAAQLGFTVLPATAP
jgi:transposase